MALAGLILLMTAKKPNARLSAYICGCIWDSVVIHIGQRCRALDGLSGVESRSGFLDRLLTDERLICKNVLEAVAKTWMRYEEEETENYYFIGVKTWKRKGLL